MNSQPEAEQQNLKKVSHSSGPQLRRPLPFWLSLAFSLLAIAILFIAWWFVTRGEGEERIVGPLTLPSPHETWGEFHSLWFDRALTRNLLVTLRRVILGFLLAVLVGIPLGVLAGCFSWIRAMLAPLVLFGRNIPLAALIPLSFFFFGIGEWQKVMFIFIACVAFVIADVTLAIADVSSRYLDTAYTLGANTWQAMVKVLVPLAMPTVFDSARVLFGLAFGYIMLAEMVKLGTEEGGIGHLIAISQRRGPNEHIYLIILIIPIVALAIDRLLYWIQRGLFPHRFGGTGWLNRALQALLHGWDDLKCRLFPSKLAMDKLSGAGDKQSEEQGNDSGTMT